MNKPSTDLLKLLPQRSMTTHKGAVGRVSVLGGTLGMTGAAILSARAALKMGAGLVTILCARDLTTIFEQQTLCVMTRGIEDRHGKLGPWSKRDFFNGLESTDSIVIGPGLGQDPALQYWIRRDIKAITSTVPTVLDADGLNALANHSQVWPGLHPKTVLTPHPGEFARWLKTSTTEIQGQREALSLKLCQNFRGSLLLKGAGTLITQGSRQVKNSTGNAGMATAGSGDVLSGVIATLLAQGLDSFEAARLGAWIHGRAGDLAAKRLGRAAMTAADIIESLSPALQEFDVLLNSASHEALFDDDSMA